jgi:hypothetical protein
VAAACVLTCALSAGAAAQEPVSGALPGGVAAPGWTLTPRFGFTTLYDDNITLFGEGSADEQNDDYVTSYAPYVDLTYRGRRTRLGVGYGGSFLNYQTFSVFDRWQQRARFDIQREESQRFQWFAHTSGSMTPSTETIDIGGIPFSHTGAKVFESRGGASYRFDMRNSLSSSMFYQNIGFERPEDVRRYLRGGRAVSIVTAYRRHLDGRIAVGADYGFRRSAVVDDVEQFNLHTAQAAIDFVMSRSWTLRASGGVVYVPGTAVSPAEAAPAYGGSALWSGRISAFHVSYDQGFIPSFGFGGTVRSQEFSAAYRTLLFRSRHFYTDHSLIVRDTDPLVESTDSIRLRSLRTNSVFGWTPEPWVRFEVFYGRTQQTSLRPGGRLDRNRIGFQIVTSKPVRMQ